jgi:hypothetical protein
MTGLPLPPAHLHALRLLIVEVEPRLLLRIAWRDLKSHAAFQRESRNRFDAPDGSFGTLYAAFDLETAFVEAVLRERPAHIKTSRIPLDFAELDARVVVNFPARSPRQLRLVQLYDEGLVAAHIDNRISTIDDYPITQRWAKAFHDHPSRADGILYLSRFLGARRSVALFDRCGSLLSTGAVTPLVEHPDLADVLDRYNIGINRP